MLIENDNLYFFVFEMEDVAGYVCKVGRSAKPEDRIACYRNRPYYVRDMLKAALGHEANGEAITFHDVERWPGLGHIEIEIMHKLRARFEWHSREWFYVHDPKQLIAFVDYLRMVIDDAKDPPTQRTLFDT